MVKGDLVHDMKAYGPHNIKMCIGIDVPYVLWQCMHEELPHVMY
jgi:hypothetical protein